jgi:hypothetical protein
MAGKKASNSGATAPPPPPTATSTAIPPETSIGRKRWIKLTPRDHVLKQIQIQRELVEDLRAQLQREEKTLEGMEKAKEFFPD